MESTLVAYAGMFFTIIVAILGAYFGGKKVATADLTKEAFKKLTQQAEQKIEDDKLISDLRTMLYAERMRTFDKASQISTASMQPKGGGH